jgi:hypothetical protein
VNINPETRWVGREEKERISAPKCADRIVCFHLINQETQFCGRIPRERVNHVYLIVFVVDVLLFVVYYTVIA